MYEVMVMLSCEDAVAVGTDAVFMAPFVSKTYCLGPDAWSHHFVCFTVVIHWTLLRKDLD